MLSSFIQERKNNFLQHPFSFLLRQIYKLLVVVPYEAVLSLLFYLPSASLGKGKDGVRDCFLVTSVIYARNDKPVSYGSVRSRFTPEENARQTTETINSIRSKMPEAKIVLIEAGLQEELPYDLDKKCDTYIYLGNNRLVRLACDSKNKSSGETLMLLTALKKIPWNAEFYFKISGRYHLNDEFESAKWRHEAIMFYDYQSDFFLTRLYAFHKRFFRVWKFALLKGLPLTVIGYAIENTLSKYIPKKYLYTMDRLGLSGLSASANDALRE